MQGTMRMNWDDRKVVLAVVEYQKVYHASVVRAVRRSLQWAQTRVIREVASTCGIDPQRLVRRRVRVTVYNGTIVRGVISIQVNNIPVIKLRGVMDTGVQSGMVRTGKGVRVPGKSMGRFYRDAFIAPGLGANWQVFRRKGKDRLPLEALKVPIRDQATAAIEKWVNASLPMVSAEVARQLALRKVISSASVSVSASDGE